MDHAVSQSRRPDGSGIRCAYRSSAGGRRHSGAPDRLRPPRQAPVTADGPAGDKPATAPHAAPVDSTERAPAVARSRARLASSVAAFLVLSPFVAWLLARAGLVPAGASVVCALTGGLAGALLLPELCQETGLVRCSMSRVTARTLTGERSVDLTRIRDLRLLTGFGYGRTFRAVVVRDRNGARIGLTAGSGASAATRPR